MSYEGFENYVPYRRCLNAEQHYYSLQARDTVCMGMNSDVQKNRIRYREALCALFDDLGLEYTTSVQHPGVLQNADTKVYEHAVHGRWYFEPSGSGNTFHYFESKNDYPDPDRNVTKVFPGSVEYFNRVVMPQIDRHCRDYNVAYRVIQRKNRLKGKLCFAVITMYTKYYQKELINVADKGSHRAPDCSEFCGDS